MTYPCYSYFEELILVLIRNWQRRLWQSLASGKEKREGGFRYEGDVQSQSYGQEKCPISNERIKITIINEKPVSLLHIIHHLNYYKNLEISQKYL